MPKTSDKKLKRPSSLSEAADELMSMLTVLYKGKTFVRTGKDLATNLFEKGLEAGSLLASIEDLTDQGVKIHTANQAILRLNQTSFILKAMEMADLYSKDDIVDLVSFIDLIIEGLRDLLIKARPSKRVVPVRNVPAQRPMVGYNNAQPVAQQVAEQPLYQPIQPVVQAQPVYAEQPVAQIETKEKNKIRPERITQVANDIEEDEDGLNDYIEISPEIIN
jgi:hypothetical protein